MSPHDSTDSVRRRRPFGSREETAEERAARAERGRIQREIAWGELMRWISEHAEGDSGAGVPDAARPDPSDDDRNPHVY